MCVHTCLMVQLFLVACTQVQLPPDTKMCFARREDGTFVPIAVRGPMPKFVVDNATKKKLPVISAEEKKKIDLERKEAVRCIT